MRKSMAILVLLLAACPHRAPHTLVPNVPTSGNPTARQRFLEVRDRFLRDGSGQADFEEIVRDFPSDPVAPFAGLYAGIAAVKAGDDKAAITDLQPIVDGEDVDNGLRARASLFLGLADNDAGDAARALPLLARGEPAIESDAERGDWIAASAVATAKTSPLAALRDGWMDRYWAIATDAEKGWILETTTAIVAGASAEDAAAAWKALPSRSGVAAAVLGARVADDLDAAGDHAGATDTRKAIADARASTGLSAQATATAAAPARPGEVGAILPLTGKQARVGEAAARGLAIAAGAHGGASAATIDVEDATGADASTAAVSTLAQDGVIGIVGPIDGDSVDAAAAQAQSLGVPILSLNPRADDRPKATALVFHVMHSAEARARILARHAAKAGVTKFAILAPDSGYGKAVAGAFADEVTAGGGTVVVRVDYPADTKNFAKTVKKLDGSWQAVFVPDQATVLALIAPALDAGGLVPRPPGGKVGKKQGRAILLLSTAEGMDEGYIHDAGRHSIGALLAPGFYPASDDATIAAFVKRYTDANGKAPTAVDAYANDAAIAIATAAGHEASRDAVARTLEAVEIDGVTGKLRFGKDHLRADDGVLFTVDKDGTTVKTIR